MSTILFIAGGVALVTGITVYFLAPKKKHTEPTFATIAPAIGNGFYGLAAIGRF